MAVKAGPVAGVRLAVFISKKKVAASVGGLRFFCSDQFHLGALNGIVIVVDDPPSEAGFLPITS